MKKPILWTPSSLLEVSLRDKIADILGKYLSTRLVNNTKIGVTPICHLRELAAPYSGHPSPSSDL
jgi:hypothetical protein